MGIRSKGTGLLTAKIESSLERPEAPLAGRSSGEDRLSLLSVRAAVNDVGVRKSSGPHHNTAKSIMALVLADNVGQLFRRGVVCLARRAPVGGERSSRHSDEELRIGRGGAGGVSDPVIIVEGGISIDGQRTRDSVVIVIVELRPKVVELGVVDYHTHLYNTWGQLFPFGRWFARDSKTSGYSLGPKKKLCILKDAKIRKWS